jgi:hypothetical protein
LLQLFFCFQQTLQACPVGPEQVVSLAWAQAVQGCKDQFSKMFIIVADGALTLL